MHRYRHRRRNRPAPPRRHDAPGASTAAGSAAARHGNAAGTGCTASRPDARLRYSSHSSSQRHCRGPAVPDRPPPSPAADDPGWRDRRRVKQPTSSRRRPSPPRPARSPALPPRRDRRYSCTVERASRTLRDTCVSLSPNPALNRNTSLIRRISALGLRHLPAPKQKGRRYPPLLAASSDATADQGCRIRPNEVPDWSEIRCRFGA